MPNLANFLEQLRSFEDKIISVDVPSAWKIDEGNVFGSFVPRANISLTSVKQCMQHFGGDHYYAGNFVPEFIYKVSHFGFFVTGLIPRI